MFGGRFSIVREVVAKIESAVNRQLREKSHFAFAGFDRGVDVVGREWREIETGTGQGFAGELLESVVADFAQVLGVQPGALLEIELRALPVDLLQLE